MKVGIVTFQRSVNYGAVLQSLALQKVIHGYGVDCDIIDYKRDNVGDTFIWLKNKIKSVLSGHPDKQLYSNIEFLELIAQRFYSKKFLAHSFQKIRHEIKYSRVVKRNELENMEKEYDFFIAGSDQIWNPSRANLDTTYLLSFVKAKKKKGSYAASFGVSEIPKKYCKEYKDCLCDFQYISCREKEGVEIVKKLTGNDAKLVLDPTFLLTKEDWLKYTEERNEKEPYILVYQLGKSSTLLKFAQKLAAKKRLNLYVMPYPRIGRNVKWLNEVEPQQWLGLIHGAEYVVTNSFHGTVFSIIFGKKFFVEVTRERIRASMGSRINNLLELFGLQNRIIEGNTISDKEIDYSKVNEILKREREASLEYLVDMLGIRKDGK